MLLEALVWLDFRNVLEICMRNPSLLKIYSNFLICLPIYLSERPWECRIDRGEKFPAVIHCCAYRGR